MAGVEDRSAEAEVPRPRRRWRPRRWRRACIVAGVAITVVLLLFATNGLLLARGGEAVVGRMDEQGVADAPATSTRSDEEIKIMAWNLAKCFLHAGGASFVPRQQVERRLDVMAALIRREAPDLLFLSEVVIECALCDVDQLAHLARATGMTHWAFGENYNFGLPLFRIVGGNAILSKRPLQPVGNHDLAGRRPFWVTRNNRRILWCSAMIGGARVLLGSMHTDSFDLDNNRRQTAQILEFAAGTPTILAGDFNATPDTASMMLVKSGRFSGAPDGPPTFPAHAPTQRLDYVWAPRGWVLRGQRVVDDRTSDHRPVVAWFRIPR